MFILVTIIQTGHDSLKEYWTMTHEHLTYIWKLQAAWLLSKLKSQCNHLDFIVLDENWVLTVNIFTKLCKNFYRWRYYESILQLNSNKHMLDLTKIKCTYVSSHFHFYCKFLRTKHVDGLEGMKHTATSQYTDTWFC
jgi:hypothetical protein